MYEPYFLPLHVASPKGGAINDHAHSPLQQDTQYPSSSDWMIS